MKILNRNLKSNNVDTFILMSNLDDDCLNHSVLNSYNIIITSIYKMISDDYTSDEEKLTVSELQEYFDDETINYCVEYLLKFKYIKEI